MLIEPTAEVVDFGSSEPGAIAASVERVGWNPADESGDWSMLIITPVTVRSWNDVGETEGRVVMRNGSWLD